MNFYQVWPTFSVKWGFLKNLWTVKGAPEENCWGRELEYGDTPETERREPLLRGNKPWLSFPTKKELQMNSLCRLCMNWNYEAKRHCLQGVPNAVAERLEACSNRREKKVCETCQHLKTDKFPNKCSYNLKESYRLRFNTCYLWKERQVREDERVG